MARSVACAVVRDDPPTVYAAEDLETLNWVLALKLVAASPVADLPEAVRGELREALGSERWGDAVELWMLHRDVVVDVYPSMQFFVPSDVELAPIELQFTALFEG